MKVHSFAYDRFYDLVYDKFRTTELSDEQRKTHGSRTPDIWELKADGVSIFDRVFGKVLGNARVFYRTRGEVRGAEDGYGSVKDSLITVGLNYIGVNLAEDFDNLHFVDDKKKAEILYQFFLEQEFPAFLRKNPEFVIYDRIKNDFLESDADSEIKKNETTIEYSSQDFSRMDYNIIKAVNDFYHFISASKIDKAWGKLAANFKKRVWKEEYEAFAIGYTNTIAINNVHVWDVQVEEDTAECKVYYLEKTAASTVVQLGHLDKLSLGDLDEFNRRLKELIVKASDTDLVDFEKIEIQKFFEPTVSEYIWYKCGMKPESIHKLLPNETTTVVPRLYSVSLSKVDDDWLISSLTPIKYQLHR